jgi:hypothetical protein
VRFYHLGWDNVPFVLFSLIVSIGAMTAPHLERGTNPWWGVLGGVSLTMACWLYAEAAEIRRYKKQYGADWRTVMERHKYQP